jgi:hypothetical protein
MMLRRSRAGLACQWRRKKWRRRQRTAPGAVEGPRGVVVGETLGLGDNLVA